MQTLSLLEAPHRRLSWRQPAVPSPSRHHDNYRLSLLVKTYATCPHEDLKQLNIDDLDFLMYIHKKSINVIGPGVVAVQVSIDPAWPLHLTVDRLTIGLPLWQLSRQD